MLVRVKTNGVAERYVTWAKNQTVMGLNDGDEAKVSIEGIWIRDEQIGPISSIFVRRSIRGFVTHVAVDSVSVLRQQPL